MICIGFSTTNSWKARLIRLFTGSKISHTFIYYTMGEQQLVLEAGWTGVEVMPWERFVQENTVVAMGTLKAPDGTNMNDSYLSDSLATVGMGYDYRGLFGMLWVMLGRKLHRHWSNPIESGKALFCSEMVTILLQKCSYPGSDKLVPRNTTPDDLYRFLGFNNNETT